MMSIPFMMKIFMIKPLCFKTASCFILQMIKAAHDRYGK